MGLGYVVRDGFLMVTSTESLDAPLTDNYDLPARDAPYLKFRSELLGR